ncbi:MAG: hypothetical protein L0206_20995, partial [Actinobacteria bacterium]|nr:hypothetical protein [Actinomycetota bacterium]
MFDSDPLGPNDPCQDRDLLVGTGNVLVLQTENYPPDSDDLFPRPNDDDDGGTIAFAFGAPVSARRIRLIDMDAGDGTSTVTLTDGANQRRIYTVPAGWTGDRLLGQPGQGLLDLTTLTAQPGFGSTATAAEDSAFDPAVVVRVDVQLGGSGAVDGLTVAGVPRAEMRVRTGTQPDARQLTSAVLPRIGTTWSALLDCSPLGQGTATLVVRRRASSGTWTPFGERLVAGALIRRESRSFHVHASAFAWDIPDDLALLGLDVHLQGLCMEFAPSSGKLRRAGGRLSNALDLVLGF